MLLYSCWVYCNCGTLFINLVKSKECVHDTLFAEALEHLYDRQGGRSGSSLECIPPFLGEGHPCSCDVPDALNDESTRELAVSGQCDLENKLSNPHRVETLQSQTPPPFPPTHSQEQEIARTAHKAMPASPLQEATTGATFNHRSKQEVCIHVVCRDLRIQLGMHVRLCAESRPGVCRRAKL